MYISVTSLLAIAQYAFLVCISLDQHVMYCCRSYMPSPYSIYCWLFLLTGHDTPQLSLCSRDSSYSFKCMHEQSNHCTATCYFILYLHTSCVYRESKSSGGHSKLDNKSVESKLYLLGVCYACYSYAVWYTPSLGLGGLC